MAMSEWQVTTRATKMTRRLENKVCIITGAGGGIGSASAVRFAREGALIVGCDIDPEGAQRTVEQVRSTGGAMVSLHPCDLTNAKQCKSLVDFAIAEFGRIDVLFNNAGKVYFNWIEQLSHEEWTQTIDHELNLVFLLTQAAWPELSKRGGAIVNTASTSGWITFKNLGGLAHCAAKAGVIAMTRQLAMEGRKYNIRANSISPGVVESPATRERFQDPVWRAQMTEKVMRGSPGRPEEIANVALFLASDESSFVNAADIIADGGMTAW
jgi:NAD(P)-dependent dehydrogenase (short-subunit alcohol dehydrogenase family)